MISVKLFPNIMIALSFLAATVYMCHGDIKKTTYWACAAVLNICVTY